MFARLGELVSRHSYLTILVWAGLALMLRLLAPAWDDITDDRDLAHLPARMPSVVGERLVEAAFPANRTKSQIVLIVAREGQEPRPSDLRVADALATRFHLLHGAADAQRAEELQQAAEQTGAGWAIAGSGGSTRAGPHRTELGPRIPRRNTATRKNASPVALHNRAIARRLLGQVELADQDEQSAWKSAPELRRVAGQVLPPSAARLPLVAVWTRHNDVVGSKLRSEDREAATVILQLSNEFMATKNIRVLQQVE